MTFVIKVPGINGLGKTEGCEKAGNAILESLKEIYTSESGKPIDVRLLDLEEIHLDNSDLQSSNQLIYKNALKTFEAKPKTIFIGGDHSISYSLTKAFYEYCSNSGESKEPCLIIFDAHPDCMASADSTFPTHEEWLKGLVEESGFPSENIMIVGIRNSDPSELDFIREKGIKIISMNQLLEDIQDTGDIITEFSDGRELYVSIDIDVIDPAFAPATGYKEPGGLTSRQLIYLIQRINKVKNLKAIDIVEINPEKDKQYDNITTKLGAKILSELI